MPPSKYILTPPDDLYPYISNNEHDQSHTKKIYPDFEPWTHTKEEDQILNNFISKGYYTTSKVNFESISARSSLNESLPKVSTQLAIQLSKVLQIRENEINKIPSDDVKNEPSSHKHSKISIFSGPSFSLPDRITLTDHRKEVWLQELSSPYVSLSKISKHIPHGLKRRQVLEQCYLKQIPLERAIWLIKCCYSMEGKVLAMKNKGSQEEIDKQLFKEWTENFVYILEKLVFEMTQHYNDSNKLKTWKIEVFYFLKLLGNCYTLELIDKEIFHHWLVEFVAKVENFEFIPLTLHMLTIFWDGICLLYTSRCV